MNMKIFAVILLCSAAANAFTQGQFQAGVNTKNEKLPGFDLKPAQEWVKEADTRTDISGSQTRGLDGQNTQDASAAMEANPKFQLNQQATDTKVNDGRQWSAAVDTQQNAGAREMVDAIRSDVEKAKGQVPAAVSREIVNIGLAFNPAMGNPSKDGNSQIGVSGTETKQSDGLNKHDASAAMEANPKVQLNQQAADTKVNDGRQWSAAVDTQQNAGSREMVDAIRSDVEKAKAQVQAGASEGIGILPGLPLESVSKDGKSQILDAKAALEANPKVQNDQQATDTKVNDGRQWSAAVDTQQNAGARETFDAIRSDVEKAKGQVPAAASREIGNIGLAFNPVMENTSKEGNSQIGVSGTDTKQSDGLNKHDASAAMEANPKFQSDQQAADTKVNDGRQWSAAVDTQQNAGAREMVDAIRSDVEKAKAQVQAGASEGIGILPGLPLESVSKDGNSQIGVSGTDTKQSDGLNKHDASAAMEANPKFQLNQQVADTKVNDGRQWSAAVDMQQNAGARERADAIRSDVEKAKGQAQAGVEKGIPGNLPVFNLNASQKGGSRDRNSQISSSESQTRELSDPNRSDTSAALDTSHKFQSDKEATVNPNPVRRLFAAAGRFRKMFDVFGSGDGNAKASVSGEAGQ